MGTKITTPGFQIPGVKWALDTNIEEDEATAERAASCFGIEPTDSILRQIEGVVRKLKEHCTHSDLSVLRKLVSRLTVRASLLPEQSSLTYLGTHSHIIKLLCHLDYGYETFRDSWRFQDMCWQADLFCDWEQKAMYEDDPRRCVIADVAAEKLSV